MTLVFLTAVPLALLGASIFLLLIAFFSFYWSLPAGGSPATGVPVPTQLIGPPPP